MCPRFMAPKKCKKARHDRLTRIGSRVALIIDGRKSIKKPPLVDFLTSDGDGPSFEKNVDASTKDAEWW